MTTVRNFCCNDFLRFSSVNLDHLTITGGTRTYFSWLAQWPDYFIVAVAPGNRIMGYILAAVQGDGEGAGSLAVAGGQEKGEGWFGQITTVSVHPEYRNRGLGTKLMRMFESLLLDKMYFSPWDLSYSMRCYVGVTNRPARIFFGKFGFENHRCLAKFIAKKEDAVDMRKVLVEGGDFEAVRLSTRDLTQTISGKKVMGEGVIEMESSGAAATAVVAGEGEVVVAEVAEAATTTAVVAGEGVVVVAKVAEAATAIVAGEGEVLVAEVAEAATAIVAGEGEVLVAEVAEAATAVAAGEGEVVVAEVAEAATDVVAGEGEVVVAEVAEAATDVVAGEGEVVVAEVAEAATDAVAGEGVVVVAKVAETTTKKPTRLERRWTLWFHNQSKLNQGAAWGSSLRKVYSFDTVEDFWGLYDQIIQPSKVPGSADFHLFKEGVEPKWEDPECANGGKWSVNCNRKMNLETMWLETLMALIGEQFDESDEICGVVVSLRQRQDKLALWTKTAADEATQMSIGRKWKEIIDTDEKITYSFHDYTKREKSAKARYYV